jgi:hypothetical protein
MTGQSAKWTTFASIGGPQVHHPQEREITGCPDDPTPSVSYI